MINMPNTKKLAHPHLRQNKRLSIKSRVDFLALSFVKSAKDLTHIKSLMKKHHAEIPVIAKIEKPEAVDNLDKILQATDAVMVARGDIGVEMRSEQAPKIQKQIIRKAIRG